MLQYNFVIRFIVKSLTFFLISFGCLANPAGSATDPRDAYDEGLTLLESGEWEEALKSWWSGYLRLEGKDEVDPRIGVAFIELAAEKEADKYFGTASKIYMWGFSQDAPEHFESVLEEAARIAPLQGFDGENEWQSRIKKKDKTLRQDIRAYWQDRDPRPTTEGNERLIEHWQRIAYARKTFTRNRNGAYDCDDRGTIYVKFGKPDKKKTGRFGSSAASQIEMKRWIGASYAQREINSYDHTPVYEVWAYGDIGTKDAAVFLFSHHDGFGAFGLVTGIESLIPKRRDIYTDMAQSQSQWGRTLRSRQPRDYLIYQIMYYSELINFDRFFLDRYSRIEQVWEGWESRFRRTGGLQVMDPAYANMLHGIEEVHENIDRLNPVYKYADSDKSDFETAMGDVKLSVQAFRLLDSDRPQLAIIASSSPELRNLDLMPNDTLVQVPEYDMVHVLFLRNSDQENVVRTQDVISPGGENISVFLSDHSEDIIQANLGAEAVDIDNRVISIGRHAFAVDPPLSPDSDRLELSDLIIGVDKPSGEHYAEFPFPVIPAKEFSSLDPLKMYFETYHTLLDENGLGNVSIEYGVTRIKGEKKKEEQIGLVYRVQPRGRTSKEELSVDISKLKPGEYEFFVKVRDEISRNEKTRTAEFEVVKDK